MLYKKSEVFRKENDSSKNWNDSDWHLGFEELNASANIQIAFKQILIIISTQTRHRCRRELFVSGVSRIDCVNGKRIIAFSVHAKVE